MAEYRIRYTKQAQDDLDAIFDYIVVENEEAAIHMLGKFETSILRLKELPRIGAALRSEPGMIVAEGYRYLVVSPYLVFYRIREQEVVIGRVLHSRQDWMPMLFGIQ